MRVSGMSQMFMVPAFKSHHQSCKTADIAARGAADLTA